jgi:DNA-binding transcriptional MerR regulator
MAQHQPIRKRSGPPPPPREIPDKLYFRIGEVAKLCEVPAYVLRFWESEFPQLKPNKGGTGQRLYRRKDVEMALRVKTLLYDEGYTIAGARQAFKTELRAGKPDAASAAAPAAETVAASHLESIRAELREIHALLSKPAASKPAVQPIRALKPVAAPRAPVQFPGPKRVEPRRPGLFDDFDDDQPA